MRAVTSVDPPGGKGTISVMDFDGKVCACRKPDGARLERIKASSLWSGERFANVHPIIPGLRDPNASMPTLSEFVCGGERRVPRGPLPTMNPLEAWTKRPASRLRATWLGHATVLIEIEGLRVLTDPDWWESHTLPNSGLTVTAAPSQHFSGRGLKDRNLTLWSSLVIRSPRHAVFFSGDTGLTTQYQAIRERLGPFDLVMLEVGAFDPAWGDIHLGPENALKALALLGGGAFLPVHWGTFSLAMHAWDQPAEVLLAQAPKAGVRLAMPHLGEAVEPADVEAAERVEPWWRIVDSATAKPESQPDTPAAITLPKAMPWPID
jgi:L-ascorbate metabolism protein UlaG (beta-lactamase superfamily)